MYDTSPLFEIVTAKYLLQTKHDTYIIGEGDNIVSAENVTVEVDFKVTDDLADKLDALVITGGDIEKIDNIAGINSILTKMYDKDKIVASICSGNSVLLNALNITINDDIHGIKTVKKNVICASAEASNNFGIYLGRLLDIYEDEDDFYETIQFFG